MLIERIAPLDGSDGSLSGLAFNQASKPPSSGDPYTRVTRSTQFDAKEPILTGMLAQWQSEPPSRSAMARLFDKADPVHAGKLLRQWRASSLAETVCWPPARRIHVALAGFTTLSYLHPLI